MTHELNVEHQAVADTATAKVMALIAQSKLVEVVPLPPVGETIA